MSKISFRVSARTARLIGRENIASSKGAIIELVKNAYDADSPICIVFFDNKFLELPDVIEKEDIVKIGKKIEIENLNKVYDRVGKRFEIKNNATESEKQQLQKEMSKLNTLYIIDAGEGMTQQVIKNNWMTIGTDNKAVDIFTKNGRIKAGAKGIGRFALDKLGDSTEMITFFDGKIEDIDDDKNRTNNSGYQWNIKWSDFECDFKTIDSVQAELYEINNKTYADILSNKIVNDQLINLVNQYDFKHGTMLKITDLRDNWNDFFINQIYSDLEVLIPPKEEKTFEVFLFSSLNKNKYGEIKGSTCDDYDYKLIAKMDKEQNVKITVYRNEYDLNLIPPDFFNRDTFKEAPYRKKDFKKKRWSTTKTLSQLLPGFNVVDDERVFNNIGVFDFTLYFMKKTFTSKDAKKFFYRNFMSHERKSWIEQFGGIKLFRDNFRVRPYGEVKDSAFDWLGLGARKAQSPAGIAKKGGGYRVNPDNIAGGIKISRLTNVDFEDKSSREGLQENKTFLIFKKIIAEIIAIFEKDRAYIARAMNKYYEDKYSEIEDKEKAEALAKKIIEENEKIRGEKNDEKSKSNNEIILAQLNKEKTEEIEQLKDEQKVLRGLASSGIVMASFTHELSNLDDVLDSRIDDLKMMFAKKIDKNFFLETPDYLNPFVLLEEMKRQDSKIQNWLRFSIGTAKKDKRTRKKTILKNYFNNFQTTWKTVLENREIKFNSTLSNKDIAMRVFEIDLDSIFNNLLVNSIDAFLRSNKIIQRVITVNILNTPKETIIDYYDNGPGLLSDITEPTKIFDALFTTKRNKFTGNEEGTGLGMWLVKTISEDNDAKVKLLFPDIGFGIRFVFPKKYER